MASLAVLDRRRLYLAEGYGSLFVYCTEVLRLSESATYKRITAARAAQRFPLVLERLAARDVTLTSIRVLAPHLTEANQVALLDEVRHCSTREVERIVARLQPRPDVPSTVRKLPTAPATSHTGSPAFAPAAPTKTAAPARTAARKVAPPSCGPAVDTGTAEMRHEPPARVQPPDRPRETVAPLAAARYKVSFTISAETYAKLREAQALLRHVMPGGDVAALFDRGLTLLLQDAAKTKHAATEQPRVRSTTPTARSRHIPADVKRCVWTRDGGQCAFVSATGHRCTERGFLEYHHCVPYATGGPASVDNISLRCKAHNAHEAQQAFGLWQQPRLVREQRLHYGDDAVAASQASTRARVRDVFAVRADQWLPGPSATGRAASSRWPAPRPRAELAPCYFVPTRGDDDLANAAPDHCRGAAVGSCWRARVTFTRRAAQSLDRRGRLGAPGARQQEQPFREG